MAIDTTDQTTPVASEDGGAVLSADDADTGAPEDEELTGAPAAGQGAARPGQQPGKRKGGASTRGERRGAFQGVATQLEEKLMGSVRNELSTMRSEFSRMLSGIQQAPQRQAAPAAQGPDPFDARLSEIDGAREAELKLLQAHDRTKGPFDFTRYRKLENDRASLIARREAQQMIAQMGLTPQMIQQMRQGGQPREAFSQEVVYTARFERLQQEFPQLADVKVAGQVGAYRRYLRQSGRQDTFETDREAAAHVISSLGLARNPVPRGRDGLYAAPGAGERGGGRPAPREVRLPVAAVNGLSADERAMFARMEFGNGDA